MLALAFVMLSTAFSWSINLCSSEEPEIKAVTMQTWPSGTIIVNVTDDVGRPLGPTMGTTVRTVGDGISWQNQTLANGTVVLTNVTAGEPGSPVAYRINATADGFRDSYPQDIVLLENETAYVDLMVFGGSISGTVTTTSGGPPGPVIGANVTISALGYSTNVSPTNGDYQLLGIPAGQHLVTANASGYVPSSQDAVVPLGKNARLDFVLISQNGSISGHVYHSTLLTPLNNTNVSVQIGLFSITVTSDSDGSYNLMNIPEGTYTLTASKDGYFSSVESGIVVSRGNRTLNVNISLTEKPTTLYGVVRSGTLLLVSANISVVGTTFFNYSGSDGSYQIWNLTAGIYTIQVSSPGYDTAIITGVVIPEGGQTQLNINLMGLPGGIIGGVVVNSVTAQPLAGVLVTIVNINPSRAGVSTDINGGYGLPGLAPGNYTVRFEKTGYRPVEISNINVTKDGQTIQDLEMTPLRNGFEGFIPGFDIPHSMMLMALCLTIIIFALAVYLRHRSFETPESAPAIYDQAEEEEAEKETTVGGEESEDLQEEVNQRKIGKSKNSGD